MNIPHFASVPWRPSLTPTRSQVGWSATAAALAVALLLKACTDDVPTAPADADAPGVALMTGGDSTRILIDPHWLTLDTTGVTDTLTATVVDAEGDTIDDAEVTWASADTSIATVDTAGVVTSVAFGSTKVSATRDSVVAWATVEVALPLTDREILEILYEATGGDDWTDNTNWLSDKELSEWFGVRTRDGRVSYVFLRDNNLVGNIPPELGGLEKLFILGLDYNDLSGRVPAALSKLGVLRDLFISGTGIGGQLPPELGHMGGLGYVHINDTDLKGRVPVTFANLDLTRFYFDYDELCIPPALAMWMDSIPETEAEYELCTDQILIDPEALYFEALGDTARLSAVLVKASGDTAHSATVTWASVDTSIATVDTTGLVTSVGYGVTEVTANSGSLADTVEVEVVRILTDREILDTLYRVTGGDDWTDTTNWLSDEPLSEWAGVYTNEDGQVDSLRLRRNNLTGSIPHHLAELDDLIHLDLSRNSLGGRIPPELGALQALSYLRLDRNDLEGRLPRKLGGMAGLRHLRIANNDFTGVVPGSFADLELESFRAVGSGVCVPPSLDEWFDGIEVTDTVARCVAQVLIEIVDLPSPTFYAIGESATLAATYVDAEGDTTHSAQATWTSGDTAVVTVDSASGRMTAVGDGTTEVTATYDSASAAIEVEVALPEDDRDVLEILYRRMHGGGWSKTTNWLSDEPLSEWAGVETDDSGRVVDLSLRGNNVRGPIHPSIGQLDALVSLDLSRNWISGDIPVELGDLALLRDLVLSINGFVGALPAGLAALDSLETLHLVATSVSGRIPAAFSDLELESLLVNGTDVCVPPSLTDWLDSIPETDDPPACRSRVLVDPRSLTFRAARDTSRLSATVIGPEGDEVDSAAVTWASSDTTVATVDTMGLVTAVAAGVANVMAAYDSVTSGAARVVVALPGSDRHALEALYRATGGDDWVDNTNWLTDEPLGSWYGVDTTGGGRVKNLWLPDNELAGRIPAAIGLLDSLRSLDLSGNDLSGPFPAAIGRLRRLTDLSLGENGLSGPLPPEMGAMTGLRYVYFVENGFSGPLPLTLADLELPRFYVGRTDVCLPRSLAAWYESREDTSYDVLPCIPDTEDREVLVTLYNETGGPRWARQDNWLTERSLNRWKGIATDDEGYVTEIFLPWNNLTDSIPPELGELSRLEVLAIYGNRLTGQIPPEIGGLKKLRELSLSGNALEGAIPPEIGGLASVDTIWLSNNRLTGAIPAEIGELAALEFLSLFNNGLTGPLPPELGKLKKLKSLWLVNNRISGPLPAELGGMTSLEDLSLDENQVSGELPPELGELRALKELGMNDNLLSGSIPPELGDLASLEVLVLSRNELTGSIPARLGRLSNLRLLWLFENQLSGSIPAALGNLTNIERMSIGTNPLSGAIPPELGKLSKLRKLYLGRGKLSGAIPPELGKLSSLTYLALFDNDLSGAIPAELGDLSALEQLALNTNRLTGAIPPELGKLSKLSYLGVSENSLEGGLPPELAELNSLETMSLSINAKLTGLLPRSFMEMESLSDIYFDRTGLCGHRDAAFQDWMAGLALVYANECDDTEVERLALAEFHAGTGGDSWTEDDGWGGDSFVGDWHGVTVDPRDSLVRRLDLPDNGLEGAIPAVVANLREMETVDLADNSLDGDFPFVMTAMDALDTIRIEGNAEMEGPLPYPLIDLDDLKALQYADTKLCASPSASFQEWIDSLDIADGATCHNPDSVKLSLPVVYLTQAVQRPEGDVDLLSNRQALLRVFLVGDEENAFFEPEVVATFTRDGKEVHRVAIPSAQDRLATSVDEGSLVASFNAVIPARHIVEGVELVVVADSAETIPRAAGSQTRFPATGSLALDVIEVPAMELTVVPVLYDEDPDSSIFAWTDSIDDDSRQVGLLKYSFPFTDFNADTREAYVTSLDLTEENNTWPLILELEKVYRADEATGYWYGVANSQEGYVRGIARLNGWVSFGKPWDTELAHEVGHSLDLLHAPCGGALGVDPDFPYPNGSIGMWGFDFRDSTVVSPKRRRDIMGYCYRMGWLSDYYFEKVVRVREEKEGEEAEPKGGASGSEGPMLVLWGGVLNGELRIEPVHPMLTRPSLPEETGPYRLDGITRDGDVEFSLSFTPGEDVYGNRYFFFAVPIEDDWEDSLDRIRLTGPEGDLTVGPGDRRSITVVTDASTGRIRGILRDWDGTLPAVLGDGDGLDVETTRGLREAVRLR